MTHVFIFCLLYLKKTKYAPGVHKEEKMKINAFINCYSMSKTLRFKLAPEYETEKSLLEKGFLDRDKLRADDYDLMKKVIDKYHKHFIDKALEGFKFDLLQDYAEAFYSQSADDDGKKLEEIKKKMCKELATCFSKQEEFKLLDKKELVEKLIPAAEFIEDEEKDIAKRFKGFTTYFTGFNENRQNLYAAELKHGTIAFRLIEENLPAFLYNCKKGVKIFEGLDEGDAETLNNELGEILSIGNVKDILSVEYYNKTLTQNGIDIYNQIIGGYTQEDGTKIKGVNEYVNLYNQTHDKKLPSLAKLKKQILSDSYSLSFLPAKFNDDSELLLSLKKFYSMVNEETGLSVEKAMQEMRDVFSHIDDCDLHNVFIDAKFINKVSNDVFGNWSVLIDGINAEYEKLNPFNGKNLDNYEEKRKAFLNKIESYSVDALQAYSGKEEKIADYVQKRAVELCDSVACAYGNMSDKVINAREGKVKLYQDDEKTEIIKTFLDAVQEFKRFAEMFCYDGTDGDTTFYGEFANYYGQIAEIIPLYNKCRNYLTKKPYSEDKIKINFDNSQLLDGWDANKEKDYLTVLLLKGNNYYLGILDKNHKNVLIKDVPEKGQGEPCFKKMIYKLLPGPEKMLPKVVFSAKNIGFYNPDREILRIRENGTFKTGDDFNIDDCHRLIDFYKECISKNEDWKTFGFRFKETSEYKNIGQFYNEVKEQGYKISFTDIPESYVKDLVNDGKLYLFRLANKDFSPYSKGKKNLHTMYFEGIFDPENIKEKVYALNGGGELFFRCASLNYDKPTHPKNVPIKNKTYDFRTDNVKKETSTFEYDLIKDKRYTKDQYTLHCPVTLNFKERGIERINDLVRQSLRESDDNYVIGIDRGERNLIYISVIDGKGKIVEQFSMNNLSSGNDVSIDFHKMLETRERERDASRKNWNAIDNIKDLKQGYLSYVVKKICDLVVKYDAIVAMEDLNVGFKHGREKFERQVYQKFEKALVDKMSYIVNKNASPHSDGGLFRAYQLTNKKYNENEKQNGFIFYVRAWNTSKIDPTTGFVNMLPLKYQSKEKSKEFFDKFEDIFYDENKDMFGFTFRYDDFGINIDHKNEWTAYSNGERIITVRNSFGKWDKEKIALTPAFKKLFDDYNVDCRGDVKRQIMNVDDKDFFVRLYKLLSYTMQLRNSDDVDDYILSPVVNAEGKFFDSRNSDGSLPCDADANGAYHIAKKAMWAIGKIKEADEESFKKTSLAIDNKTWLEFVQKA